MPRRRTTRARGRTRTRSSNSDRRSPTGRGDGPTFADRVSRTGSVELTFFQKGITINSSAVRIKTAEATLFAGGRRPTAHTTHPSSRRSPQHGDRKEVPLPLSYARLLPAHSTHPLLLRTRHSALRTRHSALGTPHSPSPSALHSPFPSAWRRRAHAQHKSIDLPPASGARKSPQGVLSAARYSSTSSVLCFLAPPRLGCRGILDRVRARELQRAHLAGQKVASWHVLEPWIFENRLIATHSSAARMETGKAQPSRWPSTGHCARHASVVAPLVPHTAIARASDAS